jgi:hypothetical protein
MERGKRDDHSGGGESSLRRDRTGTFLAPEVPEQVLSTAPNGYAGRGTEGVQRISVSNLRGAILRRGDPRSPLSAPSGWGWDRTREGPRAPIMSYREVALGGATHSAIATPPSPHDPRRPRRGASPRHSGWQASKVGSAVHERRGFPPALGAAWTGTGWEAGSPVAGATGLCRRNVLR